MDCCNNKRKRDRDARVRNVLAFKREELIADIEGYAFVSGDVMPAEEEHTKHQVFDIAQEGNEELVTRMLNLAHAETVESLYPYTKTECITDETHDDTLTEREVYRIELSLPVQFSRTTVKLLSGLIHDYMVCRVLTEWFGITYPPVLTYWRERLEELRDRMRRAIMGRRKPLRRGQSMF